MTQQALREEGLASRHKECAKETERCQQGGWSSASAYLALRAGRGTAKKIICPVTKLEKHLSAILYVDNMVILHIDLTKIKKVNKVHQRIQESVNSWGNLLIATGGA
jgi:hypothetical protein